MVYTKTDISDIIKAHAQKLGFEACGFCKAEDIGEEKTRLYDWLGNGYHADMHYLANNPDKRVNPSLLADGSKSIISLALNYYPSEKQKTANPQFAYYAYGKDYHDVMKNKMQELLNHIRSLIPETEGRCFCDTAPILERFWAAKAGIGFIGKNSLLIIPGNGSYFFLGEIILNIELEYDQPLKQSCGNCRRCLETCPTGALCSPYIVDSRKCISYQTIENKGDIDKEIIPHLSNYIYGCDLCQQACPWNRFAYPNAEPAFQASDEFLNLSEEQLTQLTIEEYRRIFKGSAIKRAKYEGLRRNILALKESKEQE